MLLQLQLTSSSYDLMLYQNNLILMNSVSQFSCIEDKRMVKNICIEIANYENFHDVNTF